MLQAVAKPAYLSRFLFCALLTIAEYCARVDVRVVSSGVGSFGSVPLSDTPARWLCSRTNCTSCSWTGGRTSDPCRGFLCGSNWAEGIP